MKLKIKFGELYMKTLIGEDTAITNWRRASYRLYQNWRRTLIQKLVYISISVTFYTYIYIYLTLLITDINLP